MRRDTETWLGKLGDISGGTWIQGGPGSQNFGRGAPPPGPPDYLSNVGLLFLLIIFLMEGQMKKIKGETEAGFETIRPGGFQICADQIEQT